MSLKILLIDLGTPRKEFNEPIGIECIATYVSNRLNNISFDLDSYDIYKNYDKPKILNYDLLGISLNLGTIDIFNDIYNFLKENNSNIPIIVGNSIPTYGFKELLKKYNDILCVRGEGEESFLQLTNLFMQVKKFTPELLKSIPNIAFLDQGNLFCNEIIPINLDQESKTIRNSKFIKFIKENHGIARIEGSRGCHWAKCNFCSIKSKYGNSLWRGYKTDKILNELVDLSNEGILSLYFTDEDFFGQNYSRILELSETIIKYKNENILAKDLNFFISILASDVINRQGFDAIKKFKEAGLREVFIGIESGESKQIKRYNKKANVDINKLALSKLEMLNLQVDIGFILFDPYLKFDDLYKNLEYLGNIKLAKYGSSSLKRLRIQPLTQTETDYKEIITGCLDLNNLEYPYNFIDNKVENVYKIFSKWERLFTDEVYLLQGKSRGETDFESNRNKTKLILSNIRKIDFDMLKNITYLINESISYTEYKNKKDKLLNFKEEILRKAQYFSEIQEF